jgi:SAM-dependent methyltransferase
LTTVDFDETSGPTIAGDFTKEWPFGEAEFDLVYLSHVVEHLYPQDRDNTIREIHRSTRPGGFVLIRVPHRSGFRATGWEHHTFYGLDGVVGLCHGYNPNLPLFRAISAGVSRTVEFDRRRTTLQRLVEGTLNKSHRATDQFLAPLIGGVVEAQFLLQRLDPEIEAAMRADFSSTAN